MPIRYAAYFSFFNHPYKLIIRVGPAEDFESLSLQQYVVDTQEFATFMHQIQKLGWFGLCDVIRTKSCPGRIFLSVKEFIGFDPYVIEAM